MSNVENLIKELVCKLEVLTEVLPEELPKNFSNDKYLEDLGMYIIIQESGIRTMLIKYIDYMRLKDLEYDVEEDPLIGYYNVISSKISENPLIEKLRNKYDMEYMVRSQMEEKLEQERTNETKKEKNRYDPMYI